MDANKPWELDYKIVDVASLKNWALNPREALDIERLINVLKKRGLNTPLLVDGRDMATVLGGNMRLNAIKQLGWGKVAISVVHPVNDADAFNIALENNETYGVYINSELIKLANDYGLDKDIRIVTQQIQIADLMPADLGSQDGGDGHGKLTDQFVVPPFSVLDSRQGYWQARRDEWLAMLGDLTATKEGVLGGGNNMLASINGGSSNFDPVLAEIMLKWFGIEQGSVLDPFGGEQTKGFVAGTLGYTYHGVDIRKEQVTFNQAVCKNLTGVNYYVGSSANLTTLVPKQQYDFVFTSPPYYDLEVYSDNKDDASTFGSYAEFMDFYKNVFTQCYELLADNRFLVVKVGEIRDSKTGVYRNFIGDNISTMLSIGFKYYNELILVNSAGTAPQRAGRSMHTRKVVKLHQNILVFYKGDPKAIMGNYKPIEMPEGLMDSENDNDED